MKTIEHYLGEFDRPTEVTLVGPQRNMPVELPFHPLIYVDGGAHQRQADEGFAVGDGDSFDGRLNQQLDPRKDFNDLAFPLHFLPQTIKKVNLFGFLGGRRDHEAANLGEVHALLKRVMPLTVFFDEEIIAFSQGTWDFEWVGLFSLMAIEPVEIVLTGACEYALPESTLLTPFSSVGLSNIANGKVSIQTNGPVFVFKVDTTVAL